MICGGPNQAAVQLASRPEAWATHALCVTGPARCGLTYLARAWAGRFGGQYLTAAEFGGLKLGALDALAGGHVALDDVDLIVAKREEPFLLFYNMVAAKGGRVLLVAHTGAASWRTGIADLRSRLNSMPVAEIGQPDEAHVRARLRAAAARRFMKLSPETINYLVPRIDLSYEAIETLMDRLSGAVSIAGKAPGLALARLVLEGLDEDREEDEGAG
ncbi:MAG: hypothetical protein CVT79_05175 [Alphaproteobacteria bacterium HGW-Alphaproteobacteria-18]|nr:MAG: hypothetical protein CVT79_05175 [Alphaproteobacteria bacterium HGW-Alphaproteobacteria-18]